MELPNNFNDFTEEEFWAYIKTLEPVVSKEIYYFTNNGPSESKDIKPDKDNPNSITPLF